MLPLPLENPVAIPEVRAEVQTKFVPFIVLAKEILVAPPVQMVCMTGVAVITGAGLTVTTTIIAEPVHPLAEGVMV